MAGVLHRLTGLLSLGAQVPGTSLHVWATCDGLAFCDAKSRPSRGKRLGRTKMKTLLSTVAALAALGATAFAQDTPMDPSTVTCADVRSGETSPGAYYADAASG